MEMDRQVLYWFSGKDRAEQNETMRVLCLLGGRQKLQKLLVFYIYIWLASAQSRSSHKRISGLLEFAILLGRPAPIIQKIGGQGSPKSSTSSL